MGSTSGGGLGVTLIFRKPEGAAFVYEADQQLSPRYASPMKDIALTKAEFTALAAIDGTQTQPPITSALQARLRLLRLIERLDYPSGPFWRTALGDRCIRRGPVIDR